LNILNSVCWPEGGSLAGARDLSANKFDISEEELAKKGILRKKISDYARWLAVQLAIINQPINCNNHNCGSGLIIGHSLTAIQNRHRINNKFICMRLTNDILTTNL
jgi:hypothetical protein